ncbi:Phosphatidyl-N-methylethanolamine N-methyltransferase [Hypocenomyce scalaris]|nr:Phosphatidyl-N-methylethanolamine N-methyltransferase [Hypocenomyce scalaris]
MSKILGQNRGLIDFDQKSLAISALSIAFNPIFWNTVARQEYHHKILTKLFNGNSRLACYALAITIFSLGIFRDALSGRPPHPSPLGLASQGRTPHVQQANHLSSYERALRAQPFHPLLQGTMSNYIGYALIASGNVLVLSSMWALGITGTYLGDYFGILMDHVVESFPFNVTGAPMYYGSTMSFLGTAILYGKPAGVFLTAEVLVVYLIALSYEE